MAARNGQADAFAARPLLKDQRTKFRLGPRSENDPEEILWCHRLPFNSPAISVASTSSFGAQEPWNRSVPTHVRHAGRPCCKRLLRAHDRCGHGVVREQPLSCCLPRRRHSFLLPGGPSVSGIGGWAT